MHVPIPTVTERAATRTLALMMGCALFPYAATAESLLDRAPQPNPVRRVDYLKWLNKSRDPLDIARAAAYHSASATLTPIGEPRKLETAANGPWQESPDVEKWLLQNAAAIESFVAATPRGPFHLGVRPAASRKGGIAWNGALMTAVVPGLSAFGDVSKALLAQGFAGWDNSDADWLIDNAITNLTLARHLDREEAMVARIAALRIAEQTYRALATAVARIDRPEALCAAIADRLDEIDPPRDDMTRAFDYQRLVAWDMLQRIYSPVGNRGQWRVNEETTAAYRDLASMLPGDAPPWDAVRASLTATGFDVALAEADTFFDQLREWNRLPPHVALPRASEIAVAGESLSNPMTRLLVQGVTRPRELHTQMMTWQRGVHLLMRIQAHRAHTNRYPESLGQLRTVPGIDRWRTDPYSGEEFIYARTRTGFVLYSVGPDQKDDANRPYLPGTKKGDLPIWPR